jgi:hypothetical protein
MVVPLSVLKRIGCFLSKLSKLTIFHSFILSNFNFCPFLGTFAQKQILQGIDPESDFFFPPPKSEYFFQQH